MPEGKDAHVLDAGIGQHPLEIRLAEDEHGRHRHRDQPKEHQQLGTEGGQAGGRQQRVRAEDRQESTVQQRPGEQRGNDRGGLAVGVGQPGVQRRQSHLGSVTDQEEQERRLEPQRIQAAGVGNQIVDRQVDRRPAGGPRGHGDEEIAQQRQGDAHRTDQQVFPRGFQRAVMAMKVDQRGAGQGGGFDAHPHQAQVPADGHQRHGRQKQQQAAGEDGLGEVHKRQLLLVVVRCFPGRLSLAR